MVECSVKRYKDESVDVLEFYMASIVDTLFIVIANENSLYVSVECTSIDATIVLHCNPNEKWHDAL